MTDGNQATVLLEITITNSGDRDAGRGKIDVDVPLGISDYGMRWTDAGGGELPDRPERAARVNGRNVLTGRLEGIGRDLPEVLHVKLPTSVPGEYAIQVRVRAEGADEATARFDLAIQQRPR